MTTPRVHEPECGYANHETLDCICDEVRRAHQRAYLEGYNDHAYTVQHWQDTHGAYRAAQVLPEVIVPDGWVPPDASLPAVTS